MIEELTRYWWVIGLRGVAAVLFALAAFFWPGITLAVLVLFFGAYALVDGVFTTITAVRASPQKQRWWVLLLEGLVGIAVGIVTILWPGLTAVALLYIIAAWAIITGVLEIIAAVRLRELIEGEWLLGLAGIASITLGLLLAFWPGPGLIATVWMIGVYAFVFGILLLALAWRLRGLRPSLSRQAHVGM